MGQEKPIRVLHVVGGMNRAGVETWLMDALRVMDRKRVEMDFMLHANQEFAYSAECRSLGARLLVCEGHYQPWRYSGNFARLLREFGPYDVVHSHVHYFTGQVLRLAKRSGVPVRIAHSHVDTSDLDVRAGFTERQYQRVMRRWIRTYSTMRIAGTEASARSLFGSDFSDGDQVKLLPYKIDLSSYGHSVDSAAVRASLGFPPAAKVIGHVGRFSRQKNHDFLIDVAVEVFRREANVYLFLLGVGELQKEIELKAAAAGVSVRVVFGGSRGDLARMMIGAMDAFVFPSYYEGNPLALIAAQASGLPCIISDTITREADIVEPLIQRLSLQSSTAEWTEAVLSALRSGPKIDRTEALRIVARKFGSSSAADELAQIYFDALVSTP
jgi:glycosyltransferase involved in cell wall biosynthesis